MGARALVGALATLALPLILLPGCASTGCEAWGTRVETVRVCNEKYAQCAYEEQPVRYCLGQSARRAAAATEPRPPASPRPQQKEGRAPEKIAAPAPLPAPRAQARREAPASQKVAKADPPAARPKGDRAAQARDASAPDLDRFWRSLYSASRYSGLHYGPVREAIRDPATMPASSARVVAALAKHVSTVVSMEVASDTKSAPIDHRLSAVVYQAHSAEAASALYTAVVRDEWRERKRLARRGVKLVVVDTGDKDRPGSSGQRIHLLRGSYVVDVNEWKSIHRDSKGKAIPGRQFPHTSSINPDIVAKAVVRSFPGN